MTVREKVKNWLSETRGPNSISAEIFEEIDLDYIRKKNAPNEQGDADGKNNLPRVDAEILSSCETGLKGDFEAYQQDYIRKYNAQQSAYLERVKSATQQWDLEAIQNEEEERFNSLIAQAKQDVAPVFSKKTELLGLAKEYLSFRREHGLMNRLPNVTNFELSIAMLLTFFAVELVFTFFLTREAGDEIHVFLLAFIYCALNCGFPFAMAAWCRPVNYRWNKAVRKLLAGALMTAIFVVGILMNLMMGHYRGVSMEIAQVTAQIDPDNMAAMQEALARSIGAGREALSKLSSSDWYDMGEPQAYLLALVGLLCMVFSFVDGFRRNDSYPGYGSLQGRYKRAYEQYAREIDLVSENLLQKQAKNVAEIEVMKKNLVASVERVPVLIHNSESIKVACENALRTLQTRLQQLVGEYRAANVAARQDREPGYFGNRIHLPDIPLTEPTFPDIDPLIKQKLEDTLSEFAERLHGEYARLIDDLETPRDVLERDADLDEMPERVEVSLSA